MFCIPTLLLSVAKEAQDVEEQVDEVQIQGEGSHHSTLGAHRLVLAGAQFQQALEQTMDDKYYEALQAIRTTGKLEKDTEEGLKAALSELLVEFTK